VAVTATVTAAVTAAAAAAAADLDRTNSCEGKWLVSLVTHNVVCLFVCLFGHLLILAAFVHFCQRALSSLLVRRLLPATV
jgi:hypothetical protein